jgi:hypothetical protein
MRVKFYKTKNYRQHLYTFRFLLFSLVFTGNVNTAGAQRFGSFVFSQLPQDYQLYPRDAQNEGKVSVSGSTELAGYKYVSVQVFRNQTLFKYLRAEIKYDSKGIGSFSAETKIKAELAEYDFKVFGFKTADSTLIVNRQNIVSGDVFVLTGQSNATGFFSETATNEYCRSFGKITENLNTAMYNPADTLWVLSNKAYLVGSVGPLGFEIQKQLVEKTGVPNCLINAGFHWSSAKGHSERNEKNPAELTSGYGRMLYRIQKAGLANAVKGFIFRQGETEAYNEGSGWEMYFDNLRRNIKLDLPNLKKIYVYQIDIIYYPTPVGATIRDYQRRLPDIYPDVRSVSTVGTVSFDGLHYGREGYQQNGLELSRLIQRDFYQLKDTLNINSPDIKKVFYTSEEKKQLVLVFDEGQQLVYPEKYKHSEHVTLDMKDFFSLDGNAGSVLSGKADNNRIILELSGSRNAATLNYLPEYVAEGRIDYPFRGPYIKNKLGMRALTFYQVPVKMALTTPVLTAAAESEGVTVLKWAPVKDATGYVIERKLTSEDAYKTLVYLNASSYQFDDKTAYAGGKTAYRVKAVGSLTESADYAYAEVETPLVLGVPAEKPDMFSVFPNPAKQNENVTISFNKPVRGILAVVNTSGQIIMESAVNENQEIDLPIGKMAGALYFIQFKSQDRQWIKKLVVR